MPRMSSHDEASGRFGLREVLVIFGLFAIVGTLWHARELRRAAAHARGHQYREMQSFMSCVEGVVMDRRVQVGVVRFGDVDHIVTESLEEGVNDFGLDQEWLAMWKSKQDLWGRELRFERTPLRGESERVVIRSAGLDGVFGGAKSDDLTARLFLSK